MKLEVDLKNLSETEKEKLLALVKKASKEPAVPYFIPEIGDTYYYITGSSAHYTTWDDDFIDRDWFAIGNCFQTEDDAKEAIIRMQMQTKWKRLSLDAGEAENPWDCEHEHFFALWNCVAQKLETVSNEFSICEKTYFPSEASLKDAIADLGEENVKKYILGVME